MVYAPGTFETDPKKQNMALQQQASAITGVTADVATNTANIATNTANIATNTANIATNTANIATNTTNIASNTSSISTLQTKTNGYESAWSTYTPTITAGSGTFTSVSAAGRYKQIGKTVFVSLKITITTVGTASGGIVATLPTTANTTVQCILAGRGNVASGNLLQGRVDTTTVVIANYNNSSAISAGEVILMSGVYEST